MVLFWLDLWKIFILLTPGFELGTSGSLVLHSTTVTWVISAFHLWQFQVFNSGAEGLVVVLFWLDLWEIFFLPTPGFELGTSGSLVLHSTTVIWSIFGFRLWQFQYSNSGAEGFVVVFFWLDQWEIFFLPTQGSWTGGPLDLYSLHSTTVPHCSFWVSPLTISGIELWCRGIGGGIVLIGPVRDFLFAHTRVWMGDLWISSPALYCSPLCLRLVVVLFWHGLWEIFFFPTPGFDTGDLWISSCTLPAATDWSSLWNRRWYCSDWTCERFSFCPHQGLNWGPLDL